jgi:hypothetical protein
MIADGDAFISLDDNVASRECARFSNPTPNPHLDVLSSMYPTFTSRENLNRQFLGKLQHRLKVIMIECREALNKDFREMMRTVLFNLLLTIRKKQLLNALWIDSNPDKLLKNVASQWILHHQVELEHYLIRKDASQPNKEIPIKHPVYIAYKVWGDETLPTMVKQETLETPYKKHEKIDDVDRWINRILRCKVHPLGNIQTKEGRLDEMRRGEIFSSDENFIRWLREDPSASFHYRSKYFVSRGAAEANTEPTEQKRTFSIDMANIATVKNSYFTELREMVDVYFPNLILDKTNPNDDTRRAYSAHTHAGPR